VADGENDHGVFDDLVAGDVSRGAVWHEELSGPRAIRIGRSQPRELLQHPEPTVDGVDRALRCVGVLLREEPMKPLEV